MLLSNGSTDVPRGFVETTRWYRFGLPSLATSNVGCNLTTIQICVVGNYEANDMPEDLKSELANAVAGLQSQYRIPDERVRLHRECSATQCPEKNVTLEGLLAWREKAGSDVDERVARQQLAAIRGPYLFGWLSKRWAGLAVVMWIVVASFRRVRRSSRTVRRNRQEEI